MQNALDKKTLTDLEIIRELLPVTFYGIIIKLYQEKGGEFRKDFLMDYERCWERDVAHISIEEHKRVGEKLSTECEKAYRVHASGLYELLVGFSLFILKLQKENYKITEHILNMANNVIDEFVQRFDTTDYIQQVVTDSAIRLENEFRANGWFLTSKILQ